ncbi:MAG: hypothetical protein HKN61_09235 [Flavobacteriaceae bacterium]|nr:hypothetical protein [Flavobacteriaceae bacterium]
MEKEIVKEYSNGDLTVVWKPKLCIHAGECVKALPEVYNPDEKPWIKAGKATTEQLKSQIALCPSAALSWYVKGEKESGDSAAREQVTVSIKPNGPLLVKGGFTLESAEGQSEFKKRPTAFCRCGKSSNKPFCDGTHNSISFDN